MLAPNLAPTQTVDPRPVADEVLVERIRAGHQEAFGELYERYFPRVYNFVSRRMRNRADAEETAQEVFVNVFSSIESFRGDAPFGAWVFGLTRRTVASRYKKKVPYMIPLADDDSEGPLQPVSSGANPHEMYELNERVARLEVALATDLTEEQQALFRLHHIEHRSIEEISQLLTKTEDAIKSHLYRARKVLLAR
jgi:RNA polymerase sigma-70 factor (ECF subfamily)